MQDRKPLSIQPTYNSQNPTSKDLRSDSTKDKYQDNAAAKILKCKEQTSHAGTEYEFAPLKYPVLITSSIRIGLLCSSTYYTT